MSKLKDVWLVVNKRGHAACLNDALNVVAHESFNSAEWHRREMEKYVPNAKPWRSVRYRAVRPKQDGTPHA